MPLSTDPAELLHAARAGHRGALARLLSMAEGTKAASVASVAHSFSGSAHVVGFTGAPGSGKSTLVNGLVSLIRSRGEEVGVLAVDPSSPFSGGAILGDRVRMQTHALDEGVFVRSMASRGALGGLAAAVPNAVRVLDAAGKPHVLIETVGVGQVEVEIVETADTVVVVLNPGWGDAVQASKAGLMEIADVFVVNKADRDGVEETVHDVNSMLDMAVTQTEWRPRVTRTVASDGTGIEEVWESVCAHQAFLLEGGGHRLRTRRRARVSDEVRELIRERLVCVVRDICAGPGFDVCIDEILSLERDPYAVSDRVIRDAGLSDLLS